MAKAKSKTGVTMPIKGEVVRINALKDGYRRAGIAHTKSPVDHPFDAFDAGQLQQLTDDPNITVAIVDAPKPSKDTD